MRILICQRTVKTASRTISGLLIAYTAWQVARRLVAAHILIAPSSLLSSTLYWHELTDAQTEAWWTYAAVVFLVFRLLVGLHTWQKARRPPFQWHTQLAVVTGASSGLGAALAKTLLAKGCRVACIDLHPCAWAKTLVDDETGNASSRLMTWQCDVARSADVHAMADAVRAHFRCDAPSILISNAGIMVGKPLLSLEEGEMERTMAVNCFATYYCLRAFLPGMLHRCNVGEGAHVCVTASIMSYVGVSQLSDYVASKHALRGMIDAVRYEIEQDQQQQQQQHRKDASPLCWSMLVLGQMRTPLFARVRMSALGQFLMPIQEPAVVAADVIRAIESRQRVSYVYRPYLARLSPFMLALPTWLRDVVQRLSGADASLQPASSVVAM